MTDYQRRLCKIWSLEHIERHMYRYEIKEALDHLKQYEQVKRELNDYEYSVTLETL